MNFNIQEFNGGMQAHGNKKKEPPFASLFKEKGISPQEVREYLESKGLNSPQEVREAMRNGEKPFAEFFEQKGISKEEVANYVQEHGSPGKGKGPSHGGPKGPPPEVMAELQKYGLQPTGSLQGDLQAIEQAKTQQNGQQGYNTNFLATDVIQNFLNNQL